MLTLLLTKPRKFFLGSAVLIGLGFLVWGVDSFLSPPRARTAAIPFADGQCLDYVDTIEKSAEPISSKICFAKTKEGGFIEQKGDFRITYDNDGYAKLTEINDPMFKQVFRGTNIFDKDMIEKTKVRSQMYGPVNLAVGTIFYDGYPVKEWAQYIGQPTYLVENNPHLDTYLLKKGPIIQAYLKLNYKYNKLIYRSKQNPKQAHIAVVERFYYNRSTGILEGRERWRIAYDENWNEIPGESHLESKSVLQH